LSEESIAVFIDNTIRVFGVEDGYSSTIIHNFEVNVGSGDLGSSRDVDEGLEITEVEVTEAIIQSGRRLNGQVVRVLAPSIISVT